MNNIHIEWEVRSLDSVTEAIVDCLHSKKPDQVDTGNICLQVFNIGENGRLNLDKIYRISQDDYFTWTRRIPSQKYDLIISKTGRIGAVAQILDEKTYAFGRNLVLIRPNLTLIDPVYLRYWMLSPWFRQEVQKYALDGTVLRSLHVKYIPSLAVVTPPLHEQRYIGELLSALDDKIELNKKMNATLEAIIMSVFKSWFVDFDPLRAKKDGHKPYGLDAETAAIFPDSLVNSEIGSIPKGWLVKKVSDIASVIDCLHSRKPVATDEGKHLLQVYNVGQTGRLDLAEPYYISESDYAEWIRRIEVRHNDLVITKTGRVGATARIRRGFKAAIGRNIVAIRAKDEECTPLFLTNCFLSDHMRREITSKTSDGTILKSLHVKAIEILNVVMPPLPLARKYDQLVKDMHDKLDKNDEEIETLSELRDTLLPKLLSGEMRIKNAENIIKGVA